MCILGHYHMHCVDFGVYREDSIWKRNSEYCHNFYERVQNTDLKQQQQQQITYKTYTFM